MPRMVPMVAVMTSRSGSDRRRHKLVCQRLWWRWWPYHICTCFALRSACFNIMFYGAIDVHAAAITGHAGATTLGWAFATHPAWYHVRHTNSRCFFRRGRSTANDLVKRSTRQVYLRSAHSRLEYLTVSVQWVFMNCPVFAET